MSKLKIAFILGTRPEAIKMAPLINLFKQNEKLLIKVCLTSQHKELLKQVLEIFEIQEDNDLDLMTTNQTLSGFGSKALMALDKYYANESPDWVFVHGDTSTAMYATLAAYYKRIKIAHIEAGLRTGNKYSPFPEEINRTLIGSIADLHFAPTELSKTNLLNENKKKDTIFVTGNTVIDAAQQISRRLKTGELLQTKKLTDSLKGEKFILITMHRRENFGDGLKTICEALRRISERYIGLKFLYPVHPNPNIKVAVERILGGIKNIQLVEPLNYVDFIFAMSNAYIILTDSGGVQEEGPSFGKPILVLRENTERPEAVDAGTVKLVGTDKEMIYSEFVRLMEEPNHYRMMSEAINPYGDGRASERILDYFLDNGSLKND